MIVVSLLAKAGVCVITINALSLMLAICQPIRETIIFVWKTNLDIYINHRIIQ